MDGEMGSALLTGTCAPHVPFEPTPVTALHPEITAPPPQELVYQHLQKRLQITCGISGTFTATCPVNSYCAYWNSLGRFDCCSATPASASVEFLPTCTTAHTSCLGSALSSSFFGTSPCVSGTACCGRSAHPQCVTGILVYSTFSYSSFWCDTAAKVVYLTAVANLLQASTVVSQVTSIVSSVATATATQVKTVTVSPSTSSSISSTSTSSSSSSTTSSISSSSVISTSSPLSTSSYTAPTSVRSSSTSSATAFSNVNGATVSSTSTWDQHKGAIIGGVVAGVLLIALVALGFFIRHRKQVKKREAGLYDGPELSGRVVSGMSYTSVPTNSYGGSHGGSHGGSYGGSYGNLQGR